jgi:hypothetical protein
MCPQVLIGTLSLSLFHPISLKGRGRERGRRTGKERKCESVHLPSSPFPSSSSASMLERHRPCSDNGDPIYGINRR